MDSASIDSSRRMAISHRLNETEKETAKKISESQESVRRAQNEASQQLDQIRDQFHRSSEAESARFEGDYQAQKEKGYQRIRELELAQNAELQRVKKEGDKLLADTTEYYARSIDRADRDGKSSLESIRRSESNQIERAERQSKAQLEDLETQHRSQLQQVLARQQEQIGQFTQTKEKKVSEAREASEGTLRSTEEHYRENLGKLLQNQQAVLNRVQEDAAGRLESLRSETSSKLSAYENRQKDPFYTLKDLNARIEDTGDGFLIRAEIPEHERDHVQVSVRGQTIVVSGQRRNEEKLEDSPGKVARTSSFQSFSQSLPINAPVEAKQLIRFFEGQDLVAWVPKFGGSRVPPQFAQAERLKSLQPQATAPGPAKPNFPKNLPLEPASKEASTEPKTPGTRKPGSSTLA